MQPSSALNRTVLTLSAVLIISYGCTKRVEQQNQIPGSESPEGQAVLHAFMAWREAVAARDGDTAARMVDSNTLRKYDRLRELAARADGTTVRGLSFMDRFEIIRLRASFTKTEIERLSASEAYAYSVRVTPNSTERLVLSGIEVNQPEGVAIAESMLWYPMTGRYQVVRDPLIFRRIDGEWRVDLTSLDDMIDDGSAIGESVLPGDPNERILSTVSAQLGTELDPSILDSPRQVSQSPN